MYRRRPNLMLGFHGCDELVRNQLVTTPDIVKKSQETYDWLGHGFYVWENNYKRAYKWALDKKLRGTLETPSVVGVIYQLDYCLDFTDSEFIDILSSYYELMKDDLYVAGKDLPKNKNLTNDKYQDLILRELDCAVIEYLHQKINEQINADVSSKDFSELKHFDTSRGVFTEGGPAFEGAGIQTKNHIQICIRNLNCIKGFFIPRKETEFP
ncbi:hypothetical protein HMPREF0765_1336 [Sphingobacterium spiritivorum ATCC 33300]|uniref:DUF3990 domain-containing protein n=1 Tax=Sphingobacterium spiritivorum ATCC 33300 TaxID=525372 RepID=C2FVI0_SPHSI|nr:hypothetical protein [Sphingobacterium spiritivorum]EEI93038.1 hypothetical protein HMPREF0765_1336 [Sphingobacterium spiritivorum ATCC 33300]QQS96189.1 hypothetical protein I6J03_00325 [Sphingobacterium spiritivorum]